MSDPTYNATKALVGERGIVDLIGVMGWYTTVSMALNVDQYPLPDDRSRSSSSSSRVQRFRGSTFRGSRFMGSTFRGSRFRVRGSAFRIYTVGLQDIDARRLCDVI
jgi:hypothetical protein